MVKIIIAALLNQTKPFINIDLTTEDNGGF